MIAHGGLVGRSLYRLQRCAHFTLTGKTAQVGKHFVIRTQSVELTVVELVLASGPDEAAPAIVGQLIGVAVGGELRRRLDPGQHAGKTGQPCDPDELRRPRGLCDHLPTQAAPQAPAQQQAQRQQCCNDAAHRIGLTNVADHLIGEDQIIEGDEIESDRELVPENRFCDGYEQQREQINQKERPAQALAPL